LNASYRLGITIVLGTVAASMAACLATVGPYPSQYPAQARAGRDLGDHGFPLGSFRLLERSGRAVTDADLAGGVWVASFIFTRCPLSCPKITSVMKGVQGKLAGTGVRLVSVSVDPEHDTPAVLADYARRFGADASRWWFLTGPKADVYELIRGRFKLPVEAASDDDQRVGAEAFSHSARLALVSRGNTVVGYFDANDPAEVADLVRRARSLDSAVPAWVRRLPEVNAGLNATCAVLLMIGLAMIRTGHWRGHAAAMVAAIVVSSLFLGSYLVYHAHAGSVPYRGVGPARLVYFTVLLSHTLLATFGVVPLVALTLLNALRRRFDRHARLARVTFPIWLYVSLTGVVIYVMLYRLPVSPSPSL
jgi:protein SCO1/2/putative membrane protein